MLSSRIVQSLFITPRSLSILPSRRLNLALFPSLYPKPRLCFNRQIHTTLIRRDSSFTNLLADETPPAVQVSSISNEGIHLGDGLLLPGATIFLEGKVYLWDTPDTSNLVSNVRENRWKGWDETRLRLFEVIVPTPEILLLGTGKTLVQPPPFLRQYLNKLGIQLDVMDTRNACSTYNLLAEEGRRVAAALLPLVPHRWDKVQSPT